MSTPSVVCSQENKQINNTALGIQSSTGEPAVEETQANVLDRGTPPSMPKRRPWSLEACRKAMTYWNYAAVQVQAQSSSDVVEELLFDMTTSNWLSEANRRYHLTQEMNIWLGKALMHHGYSWPHLGNGLGGRKLVAVDSAPSTVLQALPDWLPLQDIEILGPQPVLKGFKGRGSWLVSQLEYAR